MDNNLNVVYTCNDKLFDGLYLSILSILNRTNSTINFYVFSGTFTEIKDTYVGVSKKHIDILQKLVKSFNEKNEVKYFDCTALYNNSIAKSKNLRVKRNSPYAILRLFIDRIVTSNDKVLYIDTDTMFNDDINTIFNFNISNYEVGVCHDVLTPTRGGKDYFNSGVILFNLKLCRKNKVFKKTIEYLTINTPKLIDQDALNFVITRPFYFPNEYRFNYQMPGIKEDTVIKHFINIPRKKLWTMSIRQWHPWRVKYILHLHNWDHEYKIFKKNKKNWK